jgi:hypothetical protein
MKLRLLDLQEISYLEVCHRANQGTRRENCYSIKRKKAMRGHKGSTIYKSGSCDLGPGYMVKARNQNKAGPRLGQTSTVIE